MKILITGGTGFVGRVLVEKLFLRGHQVVVLSRSARRAAAGMPVPCELHQWESLEERVPPEALQGVEAVVNLLGENIAAKRWTSAQKKKILQSRVKGTENLVQSIRQNGPNVRVVVTTSAIGIYPVGRDDELDESTPLAGGEFLPAVCKRWEEALEPLGSLRRAVIRVGVVLGAGGGVLGKLLPLFRLGLGGAIGRGERFMSWIHVKDLADLYAMAIEDESFSGVYNGVASYVSNGKFVQALGKTLFRPALLPVPPLALKMLLGEMSCLMLDSQKVVSARLLNSPFVWQFPAIESALADICRRGARAKR